MKQLVTICILAIGMMASAQRNQEKVNTQIFTKPIKLMTVGKGVVTDNLLVRGADKTIKELAVQSITSVPNLQQVVDKGSVITNGTAKIDVQPEVFSLTKNHTPSRATTAEIGFPIDYATALEGNVFSLSQNYKCGTFSDCVQEVIKSKLKLAADFNNENLLSSEKIIKLPYTNGIALISNTDNPAPSNTISRGTKGEVIITDEYLYICIEKDRWVRTVVSNF